MDKEILIQSETINKHTYLNRILNLFIIILIVLNTIAVIIETVDGFYNQYHNYFRLFEIFSIAVFTIEYITRLFLFAKHDNSENQFKAVFKYIISPMALVDLFAILPFYIPLLLPIDLRFIRSIRIFRLMRIFKLSRYTHAFNRLANVIRSKKDELLMSGLLIFVLLIIASSLMYYVEKDAQPDKFTSIPAALWWGIATLTTIGYGDIYPTTLLGKIISALISLLGIGVFALPAGILGSGFLEEVQKNKSENKICPHCKKAL
jgi:voltage-gated potassium channel